MGCLEEVWVCTGVRNGTIKPRWVSRGSGVIQRRVICSRLHVLPLCSHSFIWSCSAEEEGNQWLMPIWILLFTALHSKLGNLEFALLVMTKWTEFISAGICNNWGNFAHTRKVNSLFSQDAQVKIIQQVCPEEPEETIQTWQKRVT